MIWVIGILFVMSLVGNYILLTRGLDAVDRIIKYEEFIKAMQRQLEHVTTTMHKIDRNGAFEADDEVGDMFKALLQITNSLENFISKE